MNEFAWSDIANSGNLYIQKNERGALRISQRMPVGGGAPADVPICTGCDVPRLLLALAGAYGVALALSGESVVTSVGFRS